LSLNNQEAGEEVRSIIGIGKERRYLLPDEEDSVLPAVETPAEPEETEHHLSGFEQIGVAAEDDIAAVGAPQAATDAVDAEHGVVAEEGELDLTPGMLDKNNDPVRLYLREMGTVPLLKRQDEVAIAKRMERGHLMVLKTISRSPIVLKELIAAGKDLRSGTLSIKKIVQFDQEELTEEETQDAGDSSDYCEDRTIVRAGTQAGRTVGENAEIEQAALFALPESPGPDASADVTACAID
jgi:RNA polymerase primary sigma factor